MSESACPGNATTSECSGDDEQDGMDGFLRFFVPIVVVLGVPLLCFLLSWIIKIIKKASRPRWGRFPCCCLRPPPPDPEGQAEDDNASTVTEDLPPDYATAMEVSSPTHRMAIFTLESEDVDFTILPTITHQGGVVPDLLQHTWSETLPPPPSYDDVTVDPESPVESHRDAELQFRQAHPEIALRRSSSVRPERSGGNTLVSGRRRSRTCDEGDYSRRRASADPPPPAYDDTWRTRFLTGFTNRAFESNNSVESVEQDSSAAEVAPGTSDSSPERRVSNPNIPSQIDIEVSSEDGDNTDAGTSSYGSSSEYRGQRI